jgi:hypothetical protein
MDETWIHIYDPETKKRKFSSTLAVGEWFAAQPKDFFGWVTEVRTTKS